VCLRRGTSRCRRPSAAGGQAGGVEVEQWAAVVGEIQLVLTVGDVDAVREEEIVAEQHVRELSVVRSVGIFRLEVANQQVGMRDFFAAELEGIDWSNPYLGGGRPDAVGNAEIFHAGTAGCNACALRGLE